MGDAILFIKTKEPKTKKGMEKEGGGVEESNGTGYAPGIFGVLGVYAFGYSRLLFQVVICGYKFTTFLSRYAN